MIATSGKSIRPKEIVRVDLSKKLHKFFDRIEKKDWKLGVYPRFINALIIVVAIIAGLNSELTAVPLMNLILIVSIWAFLWRSRNIITVVVKYVGVVLLGKYVVASVIHALLSSYSWIRYLTKALPRYVISKLRVAFFRQNVDKMAYEFRLSPRDFSFWGWNPCYEAYQALEELRAVDVLRNAIEEKVHVDLAAKGLLLYESDNPTTLELIANAKTELASNAEFLLTNAE